MPDVKQFNILGEIIKVKDNVARNIDVSSASVALFGTTTAYYFNKSKVMLEKYPDMKILDYTASDSTFVSTYMRKLKEIDLYNAADYCVIWFGDEDITENVDWGKGIDWNTPIINILWGISIILWALFTQFIVNII